MKKSLSLFFGLLFSGAVFSQTEPANYKAVLDKFGLFYNTNKPDSIFSMFGPEMVAALPIDKTRETFSQLKSQLGNLSQATFAEYDSRLNVASYDAIFQNGPITIKFGVNKNAKLTTLLFGPAASRAVAVKNDDPNISETAISQKVFTGNISGTLAMPKSASGKVPVVLIIAGSGPTDRDGNSPMGITPNTYKMLASELGKNGIATLRYDKRMVGQSSSTTKEKDLRFGDYVDDAIALINLLHSDARFSKVLVLGHSEGSLVGMLACDDQPVNGFISVAGPAERGDKIMTDQLKSKPQFIQDGFKTVVDSLKKGKTTDKVDPSIYALARPSIQPYLLSWFYHEPKTDIKKLKIPILIVQGTNDIQVPPVEAEKLKKAAKTEATVLMVNGMNHVLKEAPADRDANIETYKNPNLPLKSELVSGIVAFVSKVK